MGLSVGSMVGAADGLAVGDGVAPGVLVGEKEGLLDGAIERDGVADGDNVGSILIIKGS